MSQLNEWLEQHVTEVEYPSGFKSSNRMFIFAYNEIFPGWSRIALENYIKTVYLVGYGIKEERVDSFYGTMTATEVVTWFKVH